MYKYRAASGYVIFVLEMVDNSVNWTTGKCKSRNEAGTVFLEPDREESHMAY